MIIDRGSREFEVKQELREICSIVKVKAGYHYTDYCFLEVIPPFIEEGIRACLDNGADYITVMPYFLYPGMKLKDSVKQSARIGHMKNLKMVITKPLSYHYKMTEVIIDRINQLKREHNIRYLDSDCDVILIGHGSSDKNARNAFLYTVNSLRPFYRNVEFCFLELDTPNIQGCIKDIVQKRPKIILLMPYFLHEGTHIKHDVLGEVRSAIERNQIKNAFMTKHLGVDEKLVSIVVERAREVETKVGL